MTKMHEHEIDLDEHLVRGLVADQFPQWADLPVTHASSAGTDNAMFRLGDTMAVRLPRIEWAVDNVEREQQWLPVIGPQLPVQTPRPLGLGRPGRGYPWPWSVMTWIDGSNPEPADVTEPFLLDLAHCLDVLHGLDEPGGPVNTRGFTFAGRDSATRASIAAMRDLDEEIDVDRVAAVWDAAFDLPACTPPGTWIHADTAQGNLLVREGRLVGLIDFAGVGRGDPAVDLGVAWTLVPRELRPTLRQALHLDDATWLRGRAWALSQACLQLPYYRETNKPLAAQARYVLTEVLHDCR
jgi:aminoglycoside phosphotransferase (APT) family kinase protein